MRPHRRQPTSLRRPWDSPGKNTGVGCHFLFQCMKVKRGSEVTQSVSDSSRPHGLQPPSLFRPWDFPGKSTGVGCHCLLSAAYREMSSVFETWKCMPRLVACQRRKWQPAPVLLPGTSLGWQSLVGCHPWGRKESDTTEQPHSLTLG